MRRKKLRRAYKNPDLSHLDKMTWFQLWCTIKNAKAWMEGLDAVRNPGLVIYFGKVKERAEELIKDNRP